MKTYKINSISKIVLALIVVCNLGCKSHLLAQTASTSPFEMRDGTIVDPQKKQLYILNPEGTVAAISIGTGETLWSNNMLAKPLALVGNKLLCQTISSRNLYSMIITQLDVNNGGTNVGVDSIGLPNEVRANLVQSANSMFDLKAKVVGNQTYFTWDYRQKPPRGMREEGEDNRTDSLLQRSGALQMNVTTGNLSTITKSQLPANITESIIPNAAQRIGEDSGQFLSRDKQHILVSRRTGSNDSFENYTWEIYSAATKQKVGQLTTYKSYAPFFVSGDLIIYEIGPYVRNNNEIMEQVPLQLVAVNLQTGATVWRKEILDTVYRGSTPP